MQLQIEISEVARRAAMIEDSISGVIIGKREIVRMLLAAMLAGGHVLLEDTPGTGKTMLAKALAASIQGDFGRIQFTPDLLPADVTGLNVYRQKEERFVFMSGPVFCNILLADEINRATPRTQSGLLESMEERQITVDGETRKLPEPFFLIATQNPMETAGTYPLPEAQMDRFMMQLSMGYPSMDEEMMIMNRYLRDDPLAEVKPVCTTQDILQMRESCRKVQVNGSVERYIAQLVQATRENPKLALGANPRGTLALLHCAQAYAAIQGREFITPDDVKELCIPVLAHRLISYATHRGESVKAILQEIMESVPVPTETYSRKDRRYRQTY